MFPGPLTLHSREREIPSGESAQAGGKRPLPQCPPESYLLPAWPTEEAHPQGPGFSQTCTNFSRRISLLLKKAEPRPASEGPQDRGREAPCPAPDGGPACLAGLWGSCMQPASQCHLDHWLGSLWASPGCPSPGLRLGLEQGRGGGAIWPWLNCQYHCAATLGLETLGGQLQVKVPRASGVALYRLPHWEPSCPPRRCPGQGWFCGSAGFHRVRSRGIGASLPHRGAVGTQAPTPQSGTGSWDSAR